MSPLKIFNINKLSEKRDGGGGGRVDNSPPLHPPS
jgi:hypothetical protein